MTIKLLRNHLTCFVCNDHFARGVFTNDVTSFDVIKLHGEVSVFSTGIVDERYADGRLGVTGFEVDSS